MNAKLPTSWFVFCFQGGIDCFFYLMHTHRDEPSIQEKAFWGLGNISGEGPEYGRMIFLHPKFDLQLYFDTIETCKNISAVRNAAWSLSHLCKREAHPPDTLVETVLPKLCEYLISISDETTLVDIVWSLSFLTDPPNDELRASVGLVPAYVSQIILLLTRADKKFIASATRLIGNLAAAPNEVVAVLLDNNVLPAMYTMLHREDLSGIVQKELCWAMSNLAAGTVDQVEKLFHYPDMMNTLVDKLKNSPHINVRKEVRLKF
jgi:hypothetical protein